jgi:hypothetical protein
VKKFSWLRWSTAEKSSETKLDALKKVRRRTDQKLKQQAAQKDAADVADDADAADAADAADKVH